VKKFAAGAGLLQDCFELESNLALLVSATSTTEVSPT